MQTIRIYDRRGGLVFSVTGIPGLVETPELLERYPEQYYNWLR